MEDLEKMAFTPDNSWLKSIELDKDRSPIPIYEQISNAFVNAMEKDLLKKGDVLPSINQLSSYFDVSRSTIEKAFNELRKKTMLNRQKVRLILCLKHQKVKGQKF